MTRETLFIVGDIIMAVALLGAIVFLVSYVVFFNWRKTQPGRALVYFIGALVAWGAQSMFARLNPDYPGRPWARILVYALIASAMWGLVVTLWRNWGREVESEPRNTKEMDDVNKRTESDT